MRAYPDLEQESMLNRTFGCVRVVWNRTLAWRHARYHGEQTKTSFTQANAYLTAMKASENLRWLGRQTGPRPGQGRPRPPQGPCLQAGLPAPHLGPAGPRP